MNEFEYEIKVEELKRLTTKKSKAAYVKWLNNQMDWNGTRDKTLLKLINQTLAYFPPDSVVGLTQLSRHASNSIGNCIKTLADISYVGSFQQTPTTNWGDYNNFINSPGIPAYLKIAVRNAELEAEQKQKEA